MYAIRSYYDYGATMDGVVMAYRAGVGNKSLHSTQYHPTGVAYPEQNVGLLITEKVRGLGAHVLNVDGEQFCFPLEPRDVESAELIQEAMENRITSYNVCYTKLLR